jgi:hypothetical protein
MNPVFARMWSMMWPVGHCGVASLCLAPLLRASLQLDLRVVVGKAHNARIHAWIESPEGDVIDPTYGQFNNTYPLHVIPAHAVVDHCGEISLSLDEEEHYRRSIKPRDNVNHGWSAKSGIKSLFSDYPRINIDTETPS